MIYSEKHPYDEMQQRLTTLHRIGAKVISVFPYDMWGVLGGQTVQQVVIVYDDEGANER